MRAFYVPLLFAVSSCGGSTAGADRGGGGGSDVGGGAARHCPAPEGARLIDQAARPSGPALAVEQWDTIPPSDQARRVQITLHEQPNAQLGWLAEVDGTLVIGISILAYCGGAYPGPGMVDVGLPAFDGPIEIRTCTWSDRECPPDLP